MVYYCCVCGLKADSENGRRLHRFPNNVTYRDRWIRIIQKFIKHHIEFRNKSRVCSSHFLKVMYKSHKYLKESAIPTVFVKSDFDDGLNNVIASTPTAAVATTTAAPVIPIACATTTAPPSSGAIKILNYTNKSNLNISSVVSNATITTTGNTVALVSGTPTTTTTSAQNKISLVPTNFLLKPQSQNLSFKSPIQLYTKPTVSISSTSTTATTTSTSMQSMKLLLVNTMPKDGTPGKQQIITSTGKQMYTTTPTTVKTTNVTPIHIQPKPMITPTSLLNGQKKPETIGKAAGFKVLLNQLVSLQRENLAVSRSRLAIEKERMTFEKQIGGQLIDILKDMSENMMRNSQPSDKMSKVIPNSAPEAQTDTVKAEVISDVEDM